MSDLPLTEWRLCSDVPSRGGWYDVLRGSEAFGDVERVRFQDGRWERESTESGVAIWGFCDHWRGVAVDPETLE